MNSRRLRVSSPYATPPTAAAEAAAMPPLSSVARAGSGFSQMSRAVAKVESWFSHSAQ
ncbi:hypothetical protein ACWFRT_21475 [Streptomyces anulatus]